MSKHFLYESKGVPKLPLIFDSNINKEIENIIEYNKFNETALARLKNTIVWISNHFAQCSIAFDYGKKFIHYDNGVIKVPTTYYGLGLEFTLSDNDKGEIFVEILRLNVNYESLGLEIPSWLQLSESAQLKLDRIITEVLNDFFRRELLIA